MRDVGGVGETGGVLWAVGCKLPSCQQSVVMSAGHRQGALWFVTGFWHLVGVVCHGKSQGSNVPQRDGGFRRGPGRGEPGLKDSDRDVEASIPFGKGRS